MKKRYLLAGVASAAVAVAAGASLISTESASTEPSGPANKILARALEVERGLRKPAKTEMQLSSGVTYALLEATGELAKRADAAGAAAAAAPAGSRARTQGCQNVFDGNGMRNVRVNQDCGLRRQAEEVVVVNPDDPSHLIAGQNDSRLGFNKCGYDWSFDGGRTWGDMVPPFYQFLLPDGRTADACSDPTATFDADRNIYVGGVIFNVLFPASAIVAAKSNAQFGGTFYHTPAPLPFQEYRTAPLGVAAADDSDRLFHDKEFIVADSWPNSPKANNVYFTWTRFAFFDEEPSQNSPIVFSQSTDGGATWSTPIEISGSAPFCTDFGVHGPHECDQDQGSHPIVAPDGTVYVAFGNGNTPELGINQVLIVKCPPTADCSQKASWEGPFRVGDLIGTHPIAPPPGDPETGCPAFRQCLPPNGYRVPEFTSISVSVDQTSNNVHVVWSDFRNGAAPCTPLSLTTEAEPPCNNDVFYAYSTDGGETWSETFNVTPTSALGNTAQWQPWHDADISGDRLYVAFYDRSYGNCEFSGCNDITLATISNPRSASPNMSYRRITTGSMPNLIPANNPVQAGFLGDYMWVDREDGITHIAWADTRPRIGTAPEEDIYYARVRR